MATFTFRCVVGSLRSYLTFIYENYDKNRSLVRKIKLSLILIRSFRAGNALQVHKDHLASYGWSFLVERSIEEDSVSHV